MIRAAVAGSSLLVSAAYAQTQTPDTLEQQLRAREQAEERQRQQQAPHVDLQGKLPEAEEGRLPVEPTCFMIERFELEVPPQLSASAKRQGASALPQNPFHFVQDELGHYAGRCIGSAGIELIVKRLTAMILAKGYTTTRLGIPEQNLSSGTLKISIVPGVIHDIRFADPATRGSWMSAFPARPGDLLNLRDLEQGLEQMKRVPSQDADLQIVPGKQPGESDVVVGLKHSKPWRLTASLDDSGTRGTGKLQAGLNLAVDNLLGLNDLFNAGLNNDADNSRGNRGTRSSNAYYSVPWGNFTFTIDGNSSYYHQLIAGAYQTFISSGKSDNLEINAAYLLHRDQSSKTSIQFRTGKRWAYAYINDTEVTVQHRHTALAELALMHKQYFGRAQLDVNFAERRGVRWFGAQGDPAGLDPSSPKFLYDLQTLDATFYTPFEIGGKALSYTGTLRAQNANSPLYATEWFAIGNRWTVRGFDGDSTLASEKGYFLRNELGIPISGTAQSAYLGLDVGRVFGPSVANLVGDKLAGSVFGLRGSLMGGLSYDVFAGWALYKPKNFGTNVPTAGFSLIYQI